MGFKSRSSTRHVPKRTPAASTIRIGDGEPWSLGELVGGCETVVIKNLHLDGNKINLATAAAESEAELLERRNVEVQKAALLWPGVAIGDGE